MPKPGKSKKACEKYKQQGRKERNKETKQLKHEKLMEKYKAKRESGNGYEYHKKDKPSQNVDRRLPYQKWTSILRLLDNKEKKEKDLARLSGKD